MKYKLILFLLALLISSCTVKKAEKKEEIITLQNSFDDKAVSWFTNTGTATIKGIAKFKSKNGELRFGEEFRVELMPYCLYSRERLQKIYQNKKSGFIYLENGVPKFTPDPEGYHKTIKTFCDKEGKFEFNNLPAGKYYIVAFMIWENQTVKTGGGLMKKVVLSEGESESIKMLNF